MQNKLDAPCSGLQEMLCIIIIDFHFNLAEMDWLPYLLSWSFWYSKYTVMQSKSNYTRNLHN